MDWPGTNQPWRFGVVVLLAVMNRQMPKLTFVRAIFKNDTRWNCYGCSLLYWCVGLPFLVIMNDLL